MSAQRVLGSFTSVANRTMIPRLVRSRPLHSIQSTLAVKQQTRKRHVLSSCGVVFGVGYVLYRLMKDRQYWPVVQAKQEGSTLPPSKRFNFIADVVEKTASSVVYIEILGRHPFTNERIPLTNGSGFIVRSDGLILTNAHVVADRATVTVKMYDGKEYVGRVESVDLKADLATVRIPAKGLNSLTLCRTDLVRPGEWVVALGSPLALSNTITAGVVSSVHRSGKELGMHKEMEYIQTDAAITFGNSGGPLVNLDGLVIGINTMKVTSGISFAVPADYALDFLEKRGQKESPERWYLGITMLTLTPSLIQELRQRDPAFPSVTAGVLIWKVVIGSPAHLSGLSPGDVIVRVGGKDVHSSQDIYKALEVHEPLQIEVKRHGKVLKIGVSPT
ncbi:serine protease HTRA2, mitochondrial-like [Ornithodoros turicata]|uniref:serine protease HTRA2, mitochondrial-like n=1 Tax=Ornithodoros turicata TaxID=34597 RepID=UPI003139D8B0